jgi:hypothetical protein
LVKLLGDAAGAVDGHHELGALPLLAQRLVDFHDVGELGERAVCAADDDQAVDQRSPDGAFIAPGGITD